MHRHPAQPQSQPPQPRQRQLGLPSRKQVAGEAALPLGAAPQTPGGRWRGPRSPAPRPPCRTVCGLGDDCVSARRPLPDGVVRRSHLWNAAQAGCIDTRRSRNHNRRNRGNANWDYQAARTARRERVSGKCVRERRGTQPRRGRTPEPRSRNHNRRNRGWHWDYQAARRSRADAAESGARSDRPNDRQRSPGGMHRRPIGTKKLYGTWLGGRDSNPDTVVQSHVSYH